MNNELLKRIEELEKELEQTKKALSVNQASGLDLMSPYDFNLEIVNYYFSTLGYLDDAKIPMDACEYATIFNSYDEIANFYADGYCTNYKGSEQEKEDILCNFIGRDYIFPIKRNDRFFYVIPSTEEIQTEFMNKYKRIEETELFKDCEKYYNVRLREFWAKTSSASGDSKKMLDYLEESHEIGCLENDLLHRDDFLEKMFYPSKIIIRYKINGMEVNKCFSMTAQLFNDLTELFEDQIEEEQ